MKIKLTNIILFLCIIAMLTGCNITTQTENNLHTSDSNIEKTNTSSVSSNPSVNEISSELKTIKPSKVIFEKKREHYFESIVLLDDSYIYLHRKENGDGDLYRYYFKTSKNYKIGTLKDHDARVNDTVLIDNKLYFYSTSCPDNMLFYNIGLVTVDLNKNQVYASNKELNCDICMYAKPLNNKIVTLKRGSKIKGDDHYIEQKICIYDPQTKIERCVLKNEYNQSFDVGVQFVQFGIGDDNNLYILEKISYKDPNHPKSNNKIVDKYGNFIVDGYDPADYNLYKYELKVYDKDFNYIKSLDFSDINPIYLEPDNMRFFDSIYYPWVVSNNYIAIRNISNQLVIGKIEGNKIRHIYSYDQSPLSQSFAFSKNASNHFGLTFKAITKGDKNIYKFNTEKEVLEKIPYKITRNASLHSLLENQNYYLLIFNDYDNNFYPFYIAKSEINNVKLEIPENAVLTDEQIAARNEKLISQTKDK